MGGRFAAAPRCNPLGEEDLTRAGEAVRAGEDGTRAALLDGDCCKVVLKKLFNDTLQQDDLAIVTMLQDEYKADL